ncbi:hypothetical protein F5887DRAFT_247418 [Amanita rubescens]|nr:hypothetical protein F5887DRAFT_247418 [Amanita rubescens]
MSSDEQSNTSQAESAAQDHSYPPSVVNFSPQLLGGATHVTVPPIGAYPPHFFAYAHPQDGNNTENGPNGVPNHIPPYMIPLPPPGMVYAFPPPQGQVPPGMSTPTPPALTKPKRKQVKMACTNCAAACKRCDDDRPCGRCQKYGITESCRDGERKQRKKGIKRGSYKRRNKNEPEYMPVAQPAVTQFASPEGYYGIYVPLPAEVPPQDGSGPANGAPPMVPYFLPAFPPYAAPYGHPAMYPGLISPGQPILRPAQPGQAQVVEPQQTIQPVVDSPGTSSAGGASGIGATASLKKRNRSSKGGESKARKVKKHRTATDKEDKDNGTAQAVTGVA